MNTRYLMFSVRESGGAINNNYRESGVRSAGFIFSGVCYSLDRTYYNTTIIQVGLYEGQE